MCLHPTVINKVTERKSGRRCWVVMYPAQLLHFLVGLQRQFVAIGRSVLGALLNLPLSAALTPGGSCVPPVQGPQRFSLPLWWSGVWWTTQSSWSSSSHLPVSLRLLLPCQPGQCGMGQNVNYTINVSQHNIIICEINMTCDRDLLNFMY